jgi:hypothetical protein
LRLPAGGTRLFAPAVLLAAFVWAPAADAHKLRVTRTVMAEAWDGGVLHLVVALKVPSGKPRQGLSLIRRDQLEPVLSARALDGLVLLAGTATVALESLEFKLRLEPDAAKPVELMIHGTTRIPAGVVDLALRTGSAGDPLTLRVLPGRRAVEWASRGRVKSGGFAAELGPADEVRWRITR